MRALHYTSHRWLVLAITPVVATRVAYGVWRSWTVLQTGANASAAVAAFGVAESIGAGATVLGYCLLYSIGVSRQIRRWRRRRVRVA